MNKRILFLLKMKRQELFNIIKKYNEVDDTPLAVNSILI